MELLLVADSNPSETKRGRLPEMGIPDRSFPSLSSKRNCCDMEECQVNWQTCMHRHPRIFNRVRKILSQTNKQHRLRVLSFGCSTGEEVRTLQQIGEDGWIVHGLEIKSDLVQRARLTDPAGIYASSALDLCPQSYDVVFCMSVLCRFPDGDFAFSEFENAAKVVATFVAPGGLLVIYNAQYKFMDTRAGADFDPLLEENRLCGGSGFVPKRTSEGEVLSFAETRDAPLMFRRRKKT